MDIREYDFDPDHFCRENMHRKIQRWIRTFGLPTKIKFYGYQSQLKRLQARLLKYKDKHDLTITTEKDARGKAGRRGMKVTIDK